MNEQRITVKEFEYGVDTFAKIFSGQQDLLKQVVSHRSFADDMARDLAQMAVAFSFHLNTLKRTYRSDEA